MAFGKAQEKARAELRLPQAQLVQAIHVGFFNDQSL